ncbi:MAG: hypothetical protein M1294_10270 [Firmicutes bacterium]|uniref:Thiosulphate:quinone oxidoreductase small subunit DoxA domain-containing protein n=1 Tax=Sulfobacillus benefaciens TaxID=453960 RepID=A0A2T2X7A4_9FIRM|nr:hypothetical protein [Bacillota bacterium]MCL5012661.1 hypothetical protein [Bacillota bacterium]PSR30383.1 MAG: hypothetical protein C7B43_06260 [Sulfobacillus benefaciens]
MTNRPIGPEAVKTPLEPSIVRRKSWVMLIIAVVVTLLAYQLEHHGLWGKLTNYSKTPQINLSGTHVSQRDLSLSLYRTGGPATYGSFVVQVTLKGVSGRRPWEVWGPKTLASLPSSALHNRYHFQQVKTGPWGLVVPLAAMARLTLPLSASADHKLKGAHRAEIIVQDVSGLAWTTVVPIR